MICHAIPNVERESVWVPINGRVPSGMRIGQTCKVPYCSKLEHMVLVENKAARWANYRQYGPVIAALPVDDYFEILNVPANPEDLKKFRAGLQNAAGLHKIAMRSYPSGGVRIYKIGQWESAWAKTKEFKSEKGILLINKRQVHVRQQRASSFFLGFMDWEPSDERLPQFPKCSFRGCPFPAICDELCRHHDSFFAHPISMTDNTVDRVSIMFSYEGDQSAREHQLYAEFLVSTDSLEKSLKVQLKGRYDDSHKNAGPIDLVPAEAPKYKQYKNPSRRPVRRVEASDEFIPAHDRTEEDEVYKELQIKDGLFLNAIDDDLSSAWESGVYE